MPTTATELVPILNRPVGDAVNAVDARELHRVLGVGRDFSTWIRERLAEAQLNKGSDFEVLPESGENGGRPRMMWILTVEAAKSVSMLERTERGREIRAYFIACERKLREQTPALTLDNPAALRLALLSYTEKVIALEATVTTQTEAINVLAPKAEVHDVIMSAAETFGFREACKTLRLKTGANENVVRDLMVKRGWVTQLGGRPMPGHYGLEQGYVTSRVREYKHEDGSQHARPELRITAKGLARLATLLTKSDAA